MRPAQIMSYPGVVSKGVGGSNAPVQGIPMQHGGSQPVVMPFRGDSKQVFRLQVVNIPSYLQPEEFRGQFSNFDGVINAAVAKDESGCALRFDWRHPALVDDANQAHDLVFLQV
jgi:hypothetical protein